MLELQVSLGQSRMTEPIEEAYFNWLCAKVKDRHDSNYVTLLEILYKTEFTWIIPGDRNRLADGIELRTYFLNESGLEKDPVWFEELCSVFEVLIAFAMRAAFQIDNGISDCFWMFIENLNLIDYRYVDESDLPVIQEILYNFIWRTYDENGYGGLFPLDNADKDQRNVEIWYQFCAWVDEKALI